MNNGAPTHPNILIDTAIDLSFCNPIISQDFAWNTMPSVFDSDHLPIVLETFIEAPDPSPVKMLSKADWNLFSNSQAWNGLPRNIDNDSCEETLEDFYSRIEQACNEAIQTYIPSKFYPKPYWSQDLTRTRHVRETLYQRYRHNRTVETLLRWKKARALHKNNVRLEKEKNCAKKNKEIKRDSTKINKNSER